MKTVKKISAFILCLAVIFSFPAGAYAQDEDENINEPVITEYANTLIAGTTFSISNGTAIVTNSYTARTATFKSAKITTKVQKKVGPIWVTVKNGSWTDTSSKSTLTKRHSVKLSSKGIYRAHTVFVMYGKNDDDKITKNVKREYK